MHDFLLVFINNFVPKTHRFFRYSTCKYTVTLKPGLGSLKVIENDTIRSGTHDFLLMFNSNHRPISHRFRDKLRFQSKIANFSNPVYLTPRWRGSHWNCVSAQGVEKVPMMGATRWSKSFKIGSVVYTQNRLWQTDGQTRCRSKDRAMRCVARVKIKQ